MNNIQQNVKREPQFVCLESIVMVIYFAKQIFCNNVRISIYFPPLASPPRGCRMHQNTITEHVGFQSHRQQKWLSEQAVRLKFPDTNGFGRVKPTKTRWSLPRVTLTAE